MRRRQIIGFAAIVLCGVGAWFLWPRADHLSAPVGSTAAVSAPATAMPVAGTAPFSLLSTATNAPATTPTFSQYRLSNTTTPLAQLIRRDTAVLLENARLDTTQPLDLPIPAHLRAEGDHGSEERHDSAAFPHGKQQDFECDCGGY